MNFLLVDVSNTRTKIVLANSETIGERMIVPTAGLTADALTEALAGAGVEASRARIDRVVLSSVVPTKNTIFEEQWGDRLTIIDHQTDLGIAIDYPHPEQIGADRLANTVAAAHLVGSPSIAIDFGTAVTFDVIDDQNGPVYVGGVIAPGLEAMTHYLHERTALLPKLDLERPDSAIGKSTTDAMLVGAVIGYRGLVKEILSEVEREMLGESANRSVPIPVVATGGNAHLVCEDISQIQEILPNLTLEGLRLVALRHSSTQ